MVTVTVPGPTVPCMWSSQLLRLILYLTQLSVGTPEEENLSDPTGSGARSPYLIGLYWAWRLSEYTQLKSGNAEKQNYLLISVETSARKHQET